MKLRFGNSLNVGMLTEYLLKNNYTIGVEGSYIFGSSVKEDVFEKYRTPDGNLLGNNRAYGSVALKERGFYIGAFVGKLFPVNKTKNARSGIRITLGLGYLQHWIRLQDDFQSVNITIGDYAKGFDKRSGGLGANQFIGYQHLSKSRTINFMIGIECMQAFTKNLRDYDFSTQTLSDKKLRFDGLFSLKGVWTLPIYVGQRAEDIYY